MSYHKRLKRLWEPNAGRPLPKLPPHAPKATGPVLQHRYPPPGLWGLPEQGPPTAAVYWDYENTASGRRFPIMTAIPDFLRRVGSTAVPAFRRAFISPARAAKLSAEVRKVMTAQGFSLVIAPRDGPDTADHALHADVVEALQSDDPTPFPELLVLISDDADFAPILRRVRRTGRTAWLVVRRHIQDRLYKAADRVLHLSAIFRALET